MILFHRKRVEVFVSHDDLGMKNGLIFSPDWYRKNIFPWYPQIWEPLKRKGKKILFLSDGDYTAVIDDIIELGVDGLFLEPMIDLETVAKKYSNTKIIVGNIDTKVLTFGNDTSIENEVKRCITQAKGCQAHILWAGGGIPQNIPIRNLNLYFAVYKKQG